MPGISLSSFALQLLNIAFGYAIIPLVGMFVGPGLIAVYFFRGERARAGIVAIVFAAVLLVSFILYQFSEVQPYKWLVIW